MWCRQKDKAAIMTLVMNAGVDDKYRVRYGVNDLVVVMDRASNKLLSYIDRNHSHASADLVRPRLSVLLCYH